VKLQKYITANVSEDGKTGIANSTLKVEREKEPRNNQHTIAVRDYGFQSAFSRCSKSRL